MKLFNRLKKYTDIKNIKFNIEESIDAITDYITKNYPNVYLSDVYNKECIAMEPYNIVIHNYNKSVVLYKGICENNCILRYFNVDHYHTLNNNGLLLSGELENASRCDNIEIIHINSKLINIPDNICIKKCCRTIKINKNAYGMKSYIGMYILVKKILSG